MFVNSSFYLVDMLQVLGKERWRHFGIMLRDRISGLVDDLDPAFLGALAIISLNIQMPEKDRHTLFDSNRYLG